MKKLSENNFITAKPKNEKLQKFISYYYFTKGTKKYSSYQFIFFPHFKNALTVYKNSTVKKADNQTIIVPDQETKYSILYTTIQKTAQLIKIKGLFDKVGVVFNPLGINNFIEGHLSIHSTDPNLHFKYFGNGLIKCLDLVYKELDLKEKVNLLDTFFKSQFQFFNEPIIINSIKFIHSNNKKLTVQLLANELKTNRKRVLREFNKHLCCSVKQYIDIVQFRRALTKYQLAKSKPKLTTLSHESNYFDQSEFIRHFKKFTKNSPRFALKEISHFGNEDTFWQIID